MKQLHAIVRGRVQGVCFRMYARDLARRLVVRGWVRNNPDGSVETVAEAEPECLRAFMDGLRRGPPGSRVDSVLPVETETVDGGFNDFRILDERGLRPQTECVGM